MPNISFLSSTNYSQKMQTLSFSVLSANYGGVEVEFCGNRAAAREIKLVPNVWWPVEPQP